MKKLIYIVMGLFLGSNLMAAKISKKECTNLGDTFIFAGGECIQTYEAEGEREHTLNIIVHGTWKEGTNTLARYSPFADDISMNTDITTVAVSLPGYSKSSTNNFEALSHNGAKNLSADKDYILFLGELIKALKEKYEASTVNYIGHSAGAAMGATLTGIKPGLINNIILAGGSYKTDKKDRVKITNYLNDLDKNTKYLLIYGSEDKISKPEITKDFYKVAKKANLQVELVEAKGAAHIDLDMTDASIEAISKMLEE